MNLRPVPIDLVAGQRSMAPLAAVARTARSGALPATMALRRLSSEICSCRGKRSGDRRNARRQDVRSAPDRRRPSRLAARNHPHPSRRSQTSKAFRQAEGREPVPRLNRTGIRPGCERLAPASTDGCGPAAEREVNAPFIRLDPGPIQKRADLARMSDGLEVTKGVPEEDTRSQGKDQRRGATPDRPGSRDNQETGRLQTHPRESAKI